MPNKIIKKYRIETTRLKGWDYGSNASYFVTICTQGRECYFGSIINGKMELTEIGIITQKYWLKIPEHFPFVDLGAFVVTPNHVHGIIIINKTDDERYDERYDGRYDGRNDGRNVETQNFASLQLPQSPQSQHYQSKNKFGPQSKNLASIIRGFKIGVTKNARQIHAGFAWQPRFHDHIIRNDESFQRIKSYINENPMKWMEDTYNGH
jgi:putative transposase